MPFITQGKTNWKYILIILILAVIVGGGILGWIKMQEVPPAEFPEVKKPEKITEEGCENIPDLGKQAGCYTDLAKETKDESYCGKIEIPEAPEVRANCYVELAILKDDPSICYKVETVSLSSSCWEYFGMKDWKTYGDKEYGYDVKYYKDWTYKEAGPYTYFFPEAYGGIQLAAIQAQVFIRNENLNQPKEGRKLNMEEQLCAAKCPPEIIYSVSNKENSKIATLRLTIQEEVCGHIECVEQRSVYPLSDSEIENIIHQMLSTFKFLE